MKRAWIAFGLIAFIAAATTLSAEESKFYPVRLDVVKILSHAEGYRVIYRKGSMGSAFLDIPIVWFVPGGKAEIVRYHDPSYPYMILYFKEGKFDHVRLYALPNTADPTWGILDPSEGKGKFTAEELKPEF